MSDSELFSGGERKEREQQMLREGRLPPGQSLTVKWPVLHYGSVPPFDAAAWDRQFESDVKAGRLNELADEAVRDLRERRSLLDRMRLI